MLNISTKIMAVNGPGIVQASRTNPLADRYWQAVNERDRGMDGLFYYAVLTTGVYCRPSCPSRRPNPENVKFFPSRDLAERAGFRACRRCHPETNGPLDPQAQMVEKVCRFIEANLETPVTLGRISQHVGLSPFHIQRTFKSLLGITPRAYADACRLESLKSSLDEGHSITRSMYDAGYGSSSRLYERSSAQLGMTPSRYAKRGFGERIRYTIASLPIGLTLVAATSKGICSIQFGSSGKDLEEQLQNQFSQAQLIRDDAGLAVWVDSLNERIRGLEGRPLPLDIQATAFQRLVWEHLQKIPMGTTQSYGEIARQIGNPKAARAVARACASNPVAVAIPCHRVVHEDGDLGGYHWGRERKKALLTNEKNAVSRASECENRR